MNCGDTVKGTNGAGSSCCSPGAARGRTEAQTTMRPAADVIEYQDRYEIILDMPGAARETAEVEFENGALTISGSSVEAASEEGMRATHREFGAARYLRRFSLGEGVDPAKVEAVLKGGVMRVVIPKAEAVKARKVAIRDA